MAVHGVSGSTPPIRHQPVNTQRVQPKQDNDGSRAGEVEAQEPNQSASAGSTLGSIIDTTA